MKDQNTKKHLLIVSLDAVTNEDLNLLLTLPNFSNFCSGGTLVRQVNSVFITNTYPVHTSVITGCNPWKHGVTENSRPSPGDMDPDWYWYAKHIKVPTLYGEAKKSGLVVASILWPVTAGAKIRYNIPEIKANKWWKNQVAVSLFNGSPFLQIGAVLKFGRNLRSISQPQVDDFACDTMCDLIKRKKPELSLLHLTDVDTQKHKYGIQSEQVSEALHRTDIRLGKLFTALSYAGIKEQCSIILFGDHSVLDVNKSINFNKAFEEKGLLRLNQRGRIKSWRAWLKCCGGTAFLYLKEKKDSVALSLATDCVNEIMAKPGGGVKRFLSVEEMELSGLGKHCPFGIEAQSGFEFDELGLNHRGAHGYSLQQENYKIFYAASGSMINPGLELSGGSITDITPLAAKLLGLPGWDMDGSMREEILK